MWGIGPRFEDYYLLGLIVSEEPSASIFRVEEFTPPEDRSSRFLHNVGNENESPDYTAAHSRK
jgi:hypothetical protein